MWVLINDCHHLICGGPGENRKIQEECILKLHSLKLGHPSSPVFWLWCSGTLDSDWIMKPAGLLRQAQSPPALADFSSSLKPARQFLRAMWGTPCPCCHCRLSQHAARPLHLQDSIWPTAEALHWASEINYRELLTWEKPTLYFVTSFQEPFQWLIRTSSGGSCQSVKYWVTGQWPLY